MIFFYSCDLYALVTCVSADDGQVPYLATYILIQNHH